MGKNTKKPKPTDAELEILSVLWEHGPSTVRFVNDQLNERREVGYTTTLKFLQIMSEKGLVTRNTEGRTHIYEAALSQHQVQDQLISKLVDTAFGGSAQKLVMQALGGSKSSKEELEAIKAYIRKLEGGKS
jgi:predicted transcriptional regulator